MSEPVGIPTLNLANLAAHFSDGDAAYQLLEAIRWPEGPVCPHCDEVNNATYLQPKGDGRKTRTGAVSVRRVWKCRACKRQFSVLIGTVFEGSKVPLPKWLLAIHMMTANKNGVAAFEIKRTLGVSMQTAWFICHRIRFAMTREPLAGKLGGNGGEIEADETYFGGNPKNRHRAAGDKAPRGRGTDKTPIVTLIDRTTGEARSRVVANVDGTNLRTVLHSEARLDSALMTDSLGAYRAIGPTFAEHHTVNHERREYARTTPNGRRATTNSVEGFYSQLKRSIDGTHHHVSREHLHRYVTEYDYRYSTRGMSDHSRMIDVVRKAEGKRLTYRDPIGR